MANRNQTFCLSWQILHFLLFFSNSILFTFTVWLTRCFRFGWNSWNYSHYQEEQLLASKILKFELLVGRNQIVKNCSAEKVVKCSRTLNIYRTAKITIPSWLYELIDPFRLRKIWIPINLRILYSKIHFSFRIKKNVL